MLDRTQEVGGSSPPSSIAQRSANPGLEWEGSGLQRFRARTSLQRLWSPYWQHEALKPP